jgi:hypothetical protein
VRITDAHNPNLDNKFGLISASYQGMYVVKVQLDGLAFQQDSFNELGYLQDGFNELQQADFCELFDFNYRKENTVRAYLAPGGV